MAAKVKSIATLIQFRILDEGVLKIKKKEMKWNQKNRKKKQKSRKTDTNEKTEDQGNGKH